MATASGRGLVASSLAALAPGVVGEGTFVMATHASYARDDAASPFRSSLVRTGVVLSGMALAFSLHGPAVLVALGLALSASNVIAALHLGARLRGALPPGGERLAPAALRAAATSLVMVVPAYALAEATPHVVPGRLGQLAGTALAALVGAAVYVALHRRCHSPELRWLQGAFSVLKPGPAA
jgi:peptidoglycan biosynthesis protein MviN/MurJ (putative lipid II flippase)